MKSYRQGDVLIIPATIPAGATVAKRHRGRIVLAEGEVTGHAHVITAPTKNAVELTTAENERFLRIVGAVDVTHDGWGVYAIHGVRVPADVIETPPEQITAERITGEANAEVRRVLIERVGHERYIAIAGAKKVSRDDWGTLWRVERPDDSPLMLVEVLNSTPEPDGQSKRYLLRVPGVPKASQPARNCVIGGEDIRGIPKTPRQALGWMGQLCSEHYVLAQQT